MLSNSYSFIFIFLPLVATVYFLLHRYFAVKWPRLFLLLASLCFMSFWNVYFALVLICSVLFNYAGGSALSISTERGGRNKKLIFIAAIAANILFLGFFKYSNFFLDNVNAVSAAQIRLLNILLPIGISFYTFMQIAWLTDVYRQGGYRYDFVSYCLYVTFFPYVISGPIVYHKEIIPQLESKQAQKFNIDNLCRGIFIFSIGLFKKTAIADTLAIIANGGFNASSALSFTEAWLTSLSFTMQLYFDFSGYTDMAIGAALIFNINIPANFNSPYKSLDIREFWHRWHITFSRFLRDYIYIPLGGNRSGEIRTLINLMLTFLIGGLWHGAAWTFVFWGFLHGSALVVHRLWIKTGLHLNKVLAWLLTFNFVNITWIFFRAKSWNDALNVLKGMAGINGIFVSPNLADNHFWQELTVVGIRFGEWRDNLPETVTIVYFLCIVLIPFVLLAKNSNQLLEKFSPNWENAMAISVLMACGLLLLNQATVFLYFKF
jgi:D-alanyl-lipoteichoic acid acyltransferase DltB (MBOAT superfamily)